MATRNPLNPEAGDVSLPKDPREVAGAIRAGALTYRVFPYYRWRYGDRGRRFTHSDSAWLAHLSRLDPRLIRGQVNWLASVLSNRGMPILLLEFHLKVLTRMLGREAPEKRERFARLSAESDRLRGERLSRIAADDFESLPRRFADQFQEGPRHLLRGAGLLLVAAVADERGGVARSVESLRQWLGDVESLRASSALRDALSPQDRAALDAESFPDRWAAALDDLTRQARALPNPIQS